MQEPLGGLERLTGCFGTKNAPHESVVKSVHVETQDLEVNTLPTFSANPHSDRIHSNDASTFKLTKGKHDVSLLENKWEQLGRVVKEETSSAIYNFFANLFNRDREKTLENLKGLLESFQNPDVVEQKDKWKNKLNDLLGTIFAKRLPKAVEDGVAALLKEAKNSGIEIRVPEIKDLEFKSNTELGRGGFGIIYKSDDGQFVIKKAFWNKVLNSADEAECKRNEAVEGGLKKMTESKEYFCFQSRNFVTRYIGSMSDGLQRFPVFEYIEGKDLDKCIHSKTKDAKPESLSWSLSQKMQVLSQMASGIAALHEAGCVNRDIKPANTMVFKQDGVLSVKLVDQGLTLDIKEKYKEIGSCGTPIYQLPPKDEKPSVSPACDVFSIGMSVAELVTGGYTDLHFFLNGKPKGGVTLNEATWSEALEKLKLQPPFIKDLVKSCCTYKPEERPTAAQIAYCLEVFSAYAETEDAKAEQETLREFSKLYSELTQKYGENFGKVEGEDIQRLKTCYELFNKLKKLREKQPVFSDVLKQAQLDRPKSIPVTMRQLLQSDKPKEQEQGCMAVLQLGKADASYQATPSYGLALLRNGRKNEFFIWASQQKSSFEDLRNRIYTDTPELIDTTKMTSKITGKIVSKDGSVKDIVKHIADKGVWNTKDIKVSKDEYRAISEVL